MIFKPSRAIKIKIPHLTTFFGKTLFFAATGNDSRLPEADPAAPEDDVGGLQDQPQLGQSLQGANPGPHSFLSPPSDNFRIIVMHAALTVRVTRLSEFSPIGCFVYFG
jgi:hypothetical protein